jgi:hypothetical protein
LDGANDERGTSGHAFLGSWLVDIGVDEPPASLNRDSINPLSADALAGFLADGTLVASLSPAYAVPNEAIEGDRLLVGTGLGSWAVVDEETVAVRCAVLLRQESAARSDPELESMIIGRSVATLFVNATVRMDAANDTFSGPYTVESHLDRAWTRNLPPLDGSVQGWRVGAATGEETG